MMITLLNATAERIPLTDGSVHCVVTSPPYWGKRNYQLPPRIYGGSPGCDHVWGGELPRAGKVTHGQGGPTLTGGHDSWGNRDGGTQGQFCQRCGAWRGNLGLESVHDCGRSWISSDEVELRDDLTEKEIQYVLEELKKAGAL